MNSEDAFVEETEMSEFEEDSQIVEFDDNARFTVSPNLVVGGGGTGTEIVGISNDYTDILNEISGKLDSIQTSLETISGDTYTASEMSTVQRNCLNQIVTQNSSIMMYLDILLVGIGLLLGLIMGKLMWGRVRV